MGPGRKTGSETVSDIIQGQHPSVNRMIDALTSENITLLQTLFAGVKNHNIARDNKTYFEWWIPNFLEVGCEPIV